MLRKFACAAVITVFGLSVALADEFQATITKVDSGKVTFKKGTTKDLGNEMTLPVTTNAPVTEGKFNAATKKMEAGVPVASGLKSEQFTKIGVKGLRATITTDAENKHITAIRVGEGNNDITGKDAKEAKITKVNAKTGTVTVKMQSNGKEVEKTFKLAENIEYADSTGRVATAEIFTSGDMVLLVERDGTVSKIAKKDTSATQKTPASK